MHTRRSQLEAIKRHKSREALAKQVGKVFSHDPFAARILTPKLEKVETRTAEKKGKPVKNASVQEQQLSLHAIRFASNTFKDIGLHNVSFVPSELHVADSIKGPKIDLIKAASLKLTATVPVVENKKIAQKPFEVNMTFSDGKFSVDSLQKDNQAFPVNKGSLVAITKLPNKKSE